VHFRIEPAKRPLEVFCPCPSIPFATSALCFAFAAILLRLQFLYNNEGDCLAEGATFSYAYSFAFLRVYARRIVRWDVTAPSFISHKFRRELKVFAFHDNSLVHLRGDDYAIQYASSYWERSMEWAIPVITRFFRFLES
jgi:hypothetical protein